MKFPNPFRSTHTDLAQQEINAVSENVDRLQKMADHHRKMADQYQAGVDMIRAGETVLDESAPAEVFVTQAGPTPIRRKGASL